MRLVFCWSAALLVHLLCWTCGSVCGASSPEITCAEPSGVSASTFFSFSTFEECEKGLGAISTYTSAVLAIHAGSNSTAGTPTASELLSCQLTPDHEAGYSLFGCSNSSLEAGEVENNAQLEVISIVSSYVQNILPWNDALGEPLPMVACSADGYVVFPAASLQSRCAETATEGDGGSPSILSLFNNLAQSFFPWADMTPSTTVRGVLNTSLKSFISTVCTEIIECTPAAAALSDLVSTTLDCNGNGDYIEGEDGSTTCICTDSWVGPSCEFSDATTCSGRGRVDNQGKCECACPPNNAFYGKYTGADCSGDPVLLALEDEENAQYTAYYIAFGIMVSLCFLGMLSLAYWCGFNGDKHYTIQGEGWCHKLTLFPFVVSFRTSDFMSDWAFYAITMRDGGFFYALASEDGLNYGAIHAAALAFCILGSILFLVELKLGFYERLTLWGREAYESGGYTYDWGAGYFWVPVTTILAMLLEDVPQLYLQTVYFKTVGFENADGVSTFSFVMSAASLVINLVTVLFECKRLRGAPNSWRYYCKMGLPCYDYKGDWEGWWCL